MSLRIGHDMMCAGLQEGGKDACQARLTRIYSVCPLAVYMDVCLSLSVCVRWNVIAPVWPCSLEDVIRA